MNFDDKPERLARSMAAENETRNLYGVITCPGCRQHVSLGERHECPAELDAVQSSHL